MEQRRISFKLSVRSVLICLCFFLASMSNGQDCKFIRNEFDTTKKYVVKITEDFKLKGELFSASICSLRLIQNDTLFFAKLFYTYSGGYGHPIILKDSPFSLYFNDDSLVLYAVRSDTMHSVYSGMNSFPQLTGKYAISRQDLERLTQLQIHKIRFVSDRKEYEIPIKKEDAENLKQYATCILTKP